MTALILGGVAQHRQEAKPASQQEDIDKRDNRTLCAIGKITLVTLVYDGCNQANEAKQHHDQELDKGCGARFIS